MAYFSAEKAEEYIGQLILRGTYLQASLLCEFGLKHTSIYLTEMLV